MDELAMMPTCRDGKRVYVTLFDEGSVDLSLKVARMLRDAGIATEVSYRPDKLKKQLSCAAAKGFQLVVIIGPDEACRNTATVKNMIDGTQRNVGLDELAALILEQGGSRAI